MRKRDGISLENPRWIYTVTISGDCPFNQTGLKVAAINSSCRMYKEQDMGRIKLEDDEVEGRVTPDEYAEIWKFTQIHSAHIR